MQHFTRRRWTTILTLPVSYSVHKGKHFLFQLWLHKILNLFTMGSVHSLHLKKPHSQVHKIKIQAALGNANYFIHLLGKWLFRLSLKYFKNVSLTSTLICKSYQEYHPIFRCYIYMSIEKLLICKICQAGFNEGDFKVAKSQRYLLLTNL